MQFHVIIIKNNRSFSIQGAKSIPIKLLFKAEEIRLVKREIKARTIRDESNKTKGSKGASEKKLQK